ncbi:T9SS type A sorting domain-containing protein [Paenimyroides baculatum]|uniref:T9SS type A sorting domain-containing protein n=1 Tax=Paenimyroides baculatum TaxID=2608000 RepID=A0A5M6CRL2_9FLAO|nr:T9SS type A sorting domain-containing protein [Paenimyroides baculatum]KAA5537613.1 T9SS type A sorting domain-containing protein [Paenimyroides baculatum]
MKKITLILFLFLAINNLFSQSLYNREWGKVNLGPSRVFEVKHSTEELFIDETYFGYIYIHNKINSTKTLFYKFPHPNPPLSKHAVRIENMKFDNNENLIVYGRTHNADLATAGAYSKTPITTQFSGFSFIAKISRSGQLLWFTYFHDLAQNASSLAIDKNNNIYVLSRRDKNDVLSTNSFQSTGDLLSNINYQEVISKLDTNGKHVWSTFYFKDDSNIRNIIASDNGLYVYGEHLGGNGSSNYFGTIGSYQEYSSGLKSNGNSGTTFITKFNFNGSRIWSSYFGEQISKCPMNNSSFPYSMTVIGDDAYILTDLINISTPAKNIATNNAYLTTPISTFKNTTLTKFTSDGKRSFTTYLHSGRVIQKTNGNDLFITGEIENTIPNLNSLTTQNAYQKQHGGKSDIYTYILSGNDSALKYGSFYGGDGVDSGVAVTTTNGYYIFGSSFGNSSASTLFDNSGGMFYGSTSAGFNGAFMAYFTTKPLSSNEFSKFNVNIYPNPTVDILNIQRSEIFPNNTSATVYGVNGKRVLNFSLQNSTLNTLDVSNLTSGVYILQISGDNVNQTFKFIKK